MIGLIIKDIYNLKKYAKTLIVLIAFYGIMSLSMDGGSFLMSMVILLFTMMPITSFSYDDIAKWDKYALSLPITKKDMVLSKYILALIMCASGTAIALLSTIILNLINKTTTMEELLLGIYISMAAGIIFFSVLLPLIYKFGVEKSRLMVLGAVAVPYLIFFIMKEIGIPFPTMEALMILLKISPLLLILIVYISYILSIKIFANKEQ